MIMRMLESIGFYESIIIIVLFSAFVIVTDEIIHARAKRRREAEQGQKGH
jgi:hypothetical protein